jgi:hypothetical protein
MSASNRAAMATMIAVLFSVTAARCSDSAGGSQGSVLDQTAGRASRKKIAANLTDLPTYPNVIWASMLGTPPNQGALYTATTNDPYPTVVAWYRSRLTGAKESVSGYIDTTTAHKEIEFHMDKWNEQVLVDFNPSDGGITSITLGQDAHH